jgi:hypothetical protein
MRENKKLWIVAIIYFLIYFIILSWAWKLWVPFNAITAIIAILLIIILVIPISIKSAEDSINFLKRRK